jgi:hypothetical protein
MGQPVGTGSAQIRWSNRAEQAPCQVALGQQKPAVPECLTSRPPVLLSTLSWDFTFVLPETKVTLHIPET